MPETPIGKVSSDVLNRVVLQHLGRADPDVVVPPRHGVDAGIIRIGEGRVLAVTTDPVFLVPAYGWRRAAWFAVHILASDVAVTGLSPRWMTVDLNLPRDLDDDGLAALWRAYARTCDDLGIAVVTGHTGRYDGCAWPMVGGATCMAVGAEDAYVTPAMAEPADHVVLTKGAAIEATALLAATFPDRVRDGVGEATWRAADALFEAMTVVPEARVAARVGLRDRGVTAMHDATEGGVLGGLVELAEASGTGMRIDARAIPVRPEVRAVCDLARIDPYGAISEGSLIATVRPEAVRGLLDAFAEAGIPAADVGVVTPAEHGTVLVDDDGAHPLRHPGADPFWAAFGAWAASAREG